MHADDAVLDEGGQGEPVEEGVDALPGPEPLLVAHALYTLQPEAKQRVDVRGLHTWHAVKISNLAVHFKCQSVSVRHRTNPVLRRHNSRPPAQQALTPGACTHAWLWRKKDVEGYPTIEPIKPPHPPSCPSPR